MFKVFELEGKYVATIDRVSLDYLSKTTKTMECLIPVGGENLCSFWGYQRDHAKLADLKELLVEDTKSTIIKKDELLKIKRINKVFFGAEKEKDKGTKKVRRIF